MVSFHVLTFCTVIAGALAQNAVIDYVENGAVLMQPGTIELNDPNPITIGIGYFEQCIGKLRLCYKSFDGRLDDGCGAGFCNFHVDIPRQKSLVATSTTKQNVIEFTLDSTGAKYCAPDFTNGVHTYEVKALPKQCTVKVVGATDPAGDGATTPETAIIVAETPSSTMSTAAIWGIGGALAVVVILAALVTAAIIVYKCVIKPRRALQANRRRAIAPPPTPQAVPAATMAPAPEARPKPATTPAAALPPTPEKKKLTLEEFAAVMPYADSVLCTFERLDHIDPEIHRAVAERWDIDVVHDVSKLEKTVLRAPADAALEALNQMTAELDIGLLKNKAKYGANDTTDEAWEYANFIGLPASACYRLFAMSYPDVFKGIDDRLDDPIIANLSVPGLYACLMHDGFDQIFKKKLIIEMRARAVKLLEHASLGELRYAAFPLYYLAKRYHKDKKTFVEGSNVEDSRRNSRRSRRSRRASIRL